MSLTLKRLKSILEMTLDPALTAPTADPGASGRATRAFRKGPPVEHKTFTPKEDDGIRDIIQSAPPTLPKPTIAEEASKIRLRRKSPQKLAGTSMKSRYVHEDIDQAEEDEKRDEKNTVTPKKKANPVKRYLGVNLKPEIETYN